MCNFHGYENARSRRMERRKALQEAHALTESLKAAIHGEVEEKTKRHTLSLTRKPINRVEKAISIRSTKTYDSSDNRCLNDVAIYSTTKYREQPKTEFGITARA
ncbi:MAG: hypothetical protein ACTH5W_19445 [Providencia sp.]|uniref:transcriptional antitermination N peptide n=1 Tax=Providencia sp. TaxID=589 RepID=UPI003F9456DA